MTNLFRPLSEIFEIFQMYDYENVFMIMGILMLFGLLALIYHMEGSISIIQALICTLIVIGILYIFASLLVDGIITTGEAMENMSSEVISAQEERIENLLEISREKEEYILELEGTINEMQWYIDNRTLPLELFGY